MEPDKILRNRTFWSLVPLLILFTVYIMKPGDLEYIILLLIYGPLLFPANILTGFGFNVPKEFYHISFTALVYGLYIWFVIMVKKMNIKVLYIISVCLLILIIFGVKGCVSSINSFT